MKVFFSLLLTGFMALTNCLLAQNDGQLVVFVQDGRSISQDFKRNTLPEIKRIARKNKIDLKIVDASQGAPQEVVYTPAIFYRKGTENLLYNGRYSDLENLSEFVASSGNDNPKPKAEPIQLKVLTWNIGRATLKTTMKINPLTGRPPKHRKFDAQKFEQEALSSLAKGMDYFKPAPDGEISPLTKSFHMAFYPVVKKGVLLIQMELYSEFDLETPVFKTVIPSGSEWKTKELAFQKAGNRLEKALIAQISNWDNGDGFDTLRADTPVKTWQYALAFAPKGNRD